MLKRLTNNITESWAPKIYIGYHPDDAFIVEKFKTALFESGIYELYYLDYSKEYDENEVVEEIKEMDIAFIFSSNNYVNRHNNFSSLEAKALQEQNIPFSLILDKREGIDKIPDYRKHLSGYNVCFECKDKEDDTFFALRGKRIKSYIIETVALRIDLDFLPELFQYFYNCKQVLSLEAAYFLISYYFMSVLTKCSEDLNLIRSWKNFIEFNTNDLDHVNYVVLHQNLLGFLKSPVLLYNMEMINKYLPQIREMVFAASYQLTNNVDPSIRFDDIEKEYATMDILAEYFHLFTAIKISLNEPFKDEFNNICAWIVNLPLIKQARTKFYILDKIVSKKFFFEKESSWTLEIYEIYLDLIPDVLNDSMANTNYFNSMIDTFHLYEHFSLSQKKKYEELIFKIVDWVVDSNVNWVTTYFRGSVPSNWAESTLKELPALMYLDCELEKFDDLYYFINSYYFVVINVMEQKDRDDIDDIHFDEYFLSYGLSLCKGTPSSSDFIFPEDIIKSLKEIKGDNFVPNLVRLINKIPFKKARITLFSCALFAMHSLYSEEIYNSCFNRLLNAYPDKNEFKLIVDELNKYLNK